MSDYKIIVDSREQLPLWKKNVIVKKLDIGDYSILGHESSIAVERKSPLDLFGTLTKGHSRFKAEIARSLGYRYFAIVVEATHAQIRDKSFNNAFKSKMRGFVINRILMTIHIKYGIPVFFCNGRNEVKSLIRDIFDSYLKVYKNNIQKQNINK
jgi:DNA excision repair protein ERCC-4